MGGLSHTKKTRGKKKRGWASPPRPGAPFFSTPPANGNLEKMRSHVETSNSSCREVERDERKECERFSIDERWVEHAKPRTIMIHSGRAEEKCASDRKECVEPVNTVLSRIRNTGRYHKHHGGNNCTSRTKWEICSGGLCDDNHDRSYDKKDSYAIAVIMRYLAARRNTLPHGTILIAFKSHIPSIRPPGPMQSLEEDSRLITRYLGYTSF